MRRSKIEMFIDILKVLRDNPRGLKMTHMMYKANINCSELKKMLEPLEEKGLIRQETPKKGRTLWFITEAGKKPLSLFRNIQIEFGVSTDECPY